MQRTFTAFCASLVLAGCAARAAAPVEPFGCQTGAWRLENGRTVTMSEIPTGGLRWRLEDGRAGKLLRDGENWRGTTGWTDRVDVTPVAFGDCTRGLVTFDGQPATRLAFLQTVTTFQGKGEILAGKLVMPPGDDPVPVLVEVHGSERDAATSFNMFQQMAPALGVGVFVYDKRGTGASTGKYTQDFDLLAADAAAAVAEARRLAGARASRIGLHGSSQGGWVAPLAAQLAPVDFVIVGYGLAENPLAENRAQTIQDVARAGYGPDEQAAAGQLADAAGEVMASNFDSGFDHLERLKKRHRKAPWFTHAKGEFTGEIAAYPPWLLRIGGPSRNQGTTWRHDPLPVLRMLDVPMLWILAGADTEAPIDETRRRLLALSHEGRPITLAEFPDTEHGMLEFEKGATDERISTRYADGYFRMVADWARDSTLPAPPYGRAAVTPSGL